MKQADLKALITLLDDQDPEIYSHIESKILELGTGLIPLLEKEWESNLNHLVQQRIESLIHQLQYARLQERLVDWIENKQDDLLFGMWVIATYLYPDLELDALKEQIENLFYEVWKQIKNDTDEFEKIGILNDVLYTQYHFSSNTKNFHSPNNSMINMVLEQKKGNPISLAVVYLLVSQRLRIPVFGVNLPKLFVLTYRSSEEIFYLNTNNRGQIFHHEDISKFIEELKIPPKNEYYEPCSHLDIIVRVLRNLEQSYTKLNDKDRVKDIRLLLTLALEG